MTLAHQYRGQLPPEIRSAIDANTRNKIVFGLNGNDAREMAYRPDGARAAWGAGSGHGPRAHGGKGTAGGRRGAEDRAGRAPANTTAKGGTANDGGPEGATPPPPPPRAPAGWRETVPSPPTPQGR